MNNKTDQGRQFITIDRRTFLGALGATGLVAAGLPKFAGAAEVTSSTKSSGSSLPLRDGWKMQSATELQMAGEGPPSADSGKWYPVTVPCTVLAGLVANGEYPDLFFGDNLKKMPTDRFSGPWWYQTQFKLPEGAGEQVWLYFKGINYRANIWLNGKKIGDAKDVVGTYRDFEFNVTDAVKRDGNNTLMVEVQPPKKNDLAITFVDWAPHPPDQNMGLWQDVELRTSGPLALRYPNVVTDLDVPSLKSAKLTVMADVANPTDKPVSGVLKAVIDGKSVQQEIKLAAGETRTVSMSAENHPELAISNPRVWWPAQLGKPEMYELQLAVEVDGKASDSLKTNFGIRNITSRLEKGKVGPTKNHENEHRLFTVNGVDLLITGGGYAPDLLQRRTLPERPNLQEDHVRYMRGMNLNTVRLEGKLEDDEFYDLCDKHGILVMAGWCCCSPWEQWKNWKEEQHTVATESLKYQIRRGRNHPSMLAWLNGSDNPPPKDVEQQYLAIEEELKWPSPTISSATAKSSGASEPSGVKMNGPYKWVPPIYWLTDKRSGGAWGFNSEVGPGAVPPPLESLEAMLPEADRWPIDKVWDFHCGTGTFGNMKDFIKSLDTRFGPSTGIADFAWKSQAQAYETIRAMYEGFRANKWESTGEIQWMLNNAWPSMIWHLYDYYFRPGGAYFATKIACEPLHVLYRYDNGAIVVANDTREDVKDLKVTAEIYGIDSQRTHKQEKSCDAMANTSTTAFSLPEMTDAASTTYFLRLTATDSAGKVRSVNSYWLSTKPDVMDFDKSGAESWNITPCKSFADYTQLQTLPKVKLEAIQPVGAKTEKGTTHVRVTNQSDAIALLVRLKLMEDDKREVLPIRWSDNYFMLLPKEQRDVTAHYEPGDLKSENPRIVVGCFNNDRG